MTKQTHTTLTDALRDSLFHNEPMRDDWVTVSEATAHTLLEHGRKLEAEVAELRAALGGVALAAVAYDDAIQSCANDPKRMASFCTADGDDLDALYACWISASRAALARGKA